MSQKGSRNENRASKKEEILLSPTASDMESILGTAKGERGTAKGERGTAKGERGAAKGERGSDGKTKDGRSSLPSDKKTGKSTGEKGHKGGKQTSKLAKDKKTTGELMSDSKEDQMTKAGVSEDDGESRKRKDGAEDFDADVADKKGVGQGKGAHGDHLKATGGTVKFGGTTDEEDRLRYWWDRPERFSGVDSMGYAQQLPLIQAFIEQRLRQKPEHPNIVLPKSRETVNQYLERHQIGPLLHFMMNTLMTAQPDDPASFLHDMARDMARQHSQLERVEEALRLACTCQK